MKRIKGFESFISESYLGGSRAPLYHTSPITNSFSILQEDKLKSTVIPDKFWSKDFPAPQLISFTRSKEFVYEDYPVTFVLDGDKLKDRFEIRPIDYFVKTVGSHMKPKSMRPEGEFEFEEAVQSKEINDLHKYLMEIRINDSFFMFYKTHPRNTREEYRESYEDLVKELINYKKKFGTKIVYKNGKEWTLEDMEKEASEFPVTESLKNAKPLTKAEIDKIDYFYHATTKNNLGSIMANGIKMGPEKVVYLSDTYDNAARFLAFRGQPIVVFKVKAAKLDKEKLEESFDHSYDFFKCHAFMYYGSIPKSAIDYENIMKYNDED